MRPLSLLLSLTIGLVLLFVPPVWAVSYPGGDAVINWNTLRFDGIPIKSTGLGEHVFVEIDTTATSPSQSAGFLDWRNLQKGITVPQAATAVSTVSSDQLSAFVSPLGSTMSATEADAARELNFTALATGPLTVSVDYTLQPINNSTSGSSGFEVASVGLSNGLLSVGNALSARDSQFLSLSSSEVPAQSGTLSVTETYRKGDTGQFSITAGSHFEGSGHSVPLPDMVWPTLACLIGMAVWMERRRHQTLRRR